MQKQRKINGNPERLRFAMKITTDANRVGFVITVVLAAGDDLLGFSSSEEESSH
jgi:hypothetical protein